MYSLLAPIACIMEQETQRPVIFLQSLCDLQILVWRWSRLYRTLWKFVLGTCFSSSTRRTGFSVLCWDTVYTLPTTCWDTWLSSSDQVVNSICTFQVVYARRAAFGRKDLIRIVGESVVARNWLLRLCISPQTIDLFLLRSPVAFTYNM